MVLGKGHTAYTSACSKTKKQAFLNSKRLENVWGSTHQICSQTRGTLSQRFGARCTAAPMLPLDFSNSFNNAEDADVLLHISVTDTLGSRKRLRQQHERTYHAHALLLKRHSPYFKACLSNEWRQERRAAKHRRTEGGPTASAADLSMLRYEIVEHVEAAMLDAMEQLLRLMYCLKVPTNVPPEKLLQVLQLADRYQADQCSELLLAHLSGLRKDTVSCEVATQLLRLPPGLQQQASFKRILGVCQDVIVDHFRDVPAVIQSEELRQDFCALPFTAVLAWVESDLLCVHSENCVVYLLAHWVKAAEQQQQQQQQQRPGGQAVQAVTAEQLEQLAHRVRVLHLGPAYQYFVVPNLDWFKSCSGMPHLQTLLAYKGRDYWGRPVYPAPKPKGLPTNSTHSWKWQGPAAWVAKPRQQGSGQSGKRVVLKSTLSWELGPAELQSLFAGWSVTSPSTYCNGFQLRISAQQKGSTPTATMGVFYHCEPHLPDGRPGHVPWPDTASTTFSKVSFTIKGPAARNPEASRTHGLCAAAAQGGCWGFPNFLRQSAKPAASVEELVAPLLVDGKLRLEMTAEGIDQPS